MFCSGIGRWIILEPVLIIVISIGVIINTEEVGGNLFCKPHYSETLLISLFLDSIDDCPSNCFGNGDCVAGTCHCFLGFKGPDCGRGESHSVIISLLISSFTYILSYIGIKTFFNPITLN